MTSAPAVRMQLGEELWIVDSALGFSRHQLREVLKHVTRLAGLRDAPSLERAFHDLFGRAVSVQRAEGAELAYVVTQVSPRATDSRTLRLRRRADPAATPRG